MSVEKQIQIQIDKHKASSEYFRFLTTLSTGSIVILTSFLEPLTSQPNLGFLVGMTLVAFMVCIVASVIAYTLVIMNFGVYFSGWELKLSVFVIGIAWLSFIVAIIALTVFGLANL
jgi:hypothetical protein